jgi:hypothetical protein
MSKARLPIVTDFPDSYSYHPMSVLLAHEETKDWYYENFINICLDKHKNTRLLDINNGFLGFYYNIFQFSISKYEDIGSDSIVDRLRHELLKESNYAYIYLDEYYISASPAYQKRRFHHQSLIYGFDDDKRVFNALAFHNVWTELEYTFDEIEKGYEAGIGFQGTIVEPYGVAFFKVYPGFSHNLYLPNVINSLSDYINGCAPRYCRYVQSNLIIQDRLVPSIQGVDGPFGLNATRETTNFLRRRAEGSTNFNDFRRIHFLYDHAKMILERLKYYSKYLSSQYQEVFVALIADYSIIVDKYQKARMKYIKMTTPSDLNVEVQRKHIKVITKYIMDAVLSEKDVLAKVVSCLRNWQDRHVEGHVETTMSTEHPLSPTISEEGTSCKKEIKLSLPTSTRITSIKFSNVADIKIYLDGIEADSYYYRNAPMQDCSYSRLNITAKEITIVAEANFPISYDDLTICVFTGEIFCGTDITASSVWVNEESGQADINHLPNRATNTFGNGYWRAIAQKEVYDGSDWLEVDLDVPQKLNRIIIGELNDYPRLKKYRISYTDPNDIQKELLTHNFERGKIQIHNFPEVTTKRIRVEFLECSADAYGYAEPQVALLEGYWCDNNITNCS